MSATNWKWGNKFPKSSVFDDDERIIERTIERTNEGFFKRGVSSYFMSNLTRGVLNLILPWGKLIFFACNEQSSNQHSFDCSYQFTITSGSNSFSLKILKMREKGIHLISFVRGKVQFFVCFEKSLNEHSFYQLRQELLQ